MPRRQYSRPTTRVRVNERTAAPNLSMVAPSYVRASDPAATAAAQLTEALGVAERFAAQAQERRRRKASLAATRAALVGREPTEEELQNDAFATTFERINAERGLVDVRREVERRYLELDKATATPAEVAAILDDVARSQFEGYDAESDLEAAVIPGLVDGLESIRTEFLERFAEDATKADREQAIGNMMAVVRDDLEATGTLDYESLRADLVALFGRSESNDMLVQMVADVAIDQGRPDLIEALPDKWADGVPGVRNITRLQEYIRNAIVRAESQRQHNESLAEAAEREALKLRREQNEAALMVDALSGRDITAAVRDMIAAGELAPETGRTLVNFQRTAANDVGQGEVNDAVSAALEVSLYTGAATITDVIDAAESIGTGNAGRSELSRLMRLAGSVQTVAAQRLSVPSYRTYQRELERLLKPTRDVFGNDDPAELARLADAMRTYDELVSEGKTPLEARNQILQRIQSTPQPTSNPADDPDDLLRQLEAGQISAEEFDRRMTAIEMAAR